MKNIAYQSGLFQAPIRSTNKEYRDLSERLEIVDRILTESGLEFEFASDYVEKLWHLLDMAERIYKSYPDAKMLLMCYELTIKPPATI